MKKLVIDIIEECWQCPHVECEHRIEHGTPEYTGGYDFINDICEIPDECPLPSFSEYPPLSTSIT